MNKLIIILLIIIIFAKIFNYSKDYFNEDKKEINLILKGTFPIGNFMIILMNSIHVALFHKYNNIIIDNHRLINTNKIIISTKENKIKKNINKNSQDFFEKTKINENKEIFDKNKKETVNILKRIFKIQDIKKYNNDDICIHIRGRDLFSKNPHPGYFTPPLDYYLHILNNNKFKNIYLVSEDKKNPLIDKLLKIYPDCKFKIQSLEEDVKLILGHQNIVFSIGTFLKSLMLISENAKVIYKPSYQSVFTDYYPNIKIINYDLEDYKKKIYPWKNTEEQRKLMIDYKLKKL